MGEILNWVSHEVNLGNSKISVEEEYANGYKFGCILVQFQELEDPHILVDNNTLDGAINNFHLLEPIFAKLGVRFNKKIMQKIINKELGAARNVLSALLESLHRNTSQRSNASAPVAQDKEREAVTTAEMVRPVKEEEVALAGKKKGDFCKNNGRIQTELGRVKNAFAIINKKNYYGITQITSHKALRKIRNAEGNVTQQKEIELSHEFQSKIEKRLKKVNDTLDGRRNRLRAETSGLRAGHQQNIVGRIIHNCGTSSRTHINDRKRFQSQQEATMLRRRHGILADKLRSNLKEEAFTTCSDLQERTLRNNSVNCAILEKQKTIQKYALILDEVQKKRTQILNSKRIESEQNDIRFLKKLIKYDEEMLEIELQGELRAQKSQLLEKEAIQKSYVLAFCRGVMDLILDVVKSEIFYKEAFDLGPPSRIWNAWMACFVNRVPLFTATKSSVDESLSTLITANEASPTSQMVGRNQAALTEVDKVLRSHKLISELELNQYLNSQGEWSFSKMHIPENQKSLELNTLLPSFLSEVSTTNSRAKKLGLQYRERPNGGAATSGLGLAVETLYTNRCKQVTNSRQPITSDSLITCAIIGKHRLGKRKCAEALAKIFDLEVISPKDLLKEALQIAQGEINTVNAKADEGTALWSYTANLAQLGHEAEASLRLGKTVDDVIYARLIAEKLRYLFPTEKSGSKSTNGWVLVGFPWSLNQYKALEKSLQGTSQDCEKEFQILHEQKLKAMSLAPVNYRHFLQEPSNQASSYRGVSFFFYLEANPMALIYDERVHNDPGAILSVEQNTALCRCYNVGAELQRIQNYLNQTLNEDAGAMYQIRTGLDQSPVEKMATVIRPRVERQADGFGSFKYTLSKRARKMVKNKDKFDTKLSEYEEEIEYQAPNHHRPDYESLLKSEVEAFSDSESKELLDLWEKLQNSYFNKMVQLFTILRINSNKVSKDSCDIKKNFVSIMDIERRRLRELSTFVEAFNATIETGLGGDNFDHTKEGLYLLTEELEDTLWSITSSRIDEASKVHTKIASQEWLKLHYESLANSLKKMVEIESECYYAADNFLKQLYLRATKECCSSRGSQIFHTEQENRLESDSSLRDLQILDIKNFSTNVSFQSFQGYLKALQNSGKALIIPLSDLVEEAEYSMKAYGEAAASLKSFGKGEEPPMESIYLAIQWCRFELRQTFNFALQKIFNLGTLKANDIAAQCDALSSDIQNWIGYWAMTANESLLKLSKYIKLHIETSTKLELQNGDIGDGAIHLNMVDRANRTSNYLPISNPSCNTWSLPIPVLRELTKGISAFLVKNVISIIKLKEVLQQFFVASKCFNSYQLPKNWKYYTTSQLNSLAEFFDLGDGYVDATEFMLCLTLNEVGWPSIKQILQIKHALQQVLPLDNKQASSYETFEAGITLDSFLAIDLGNWLSPSKCEGGSTDSEDLLDSSAAVKTESTTEVDEFKRLIFEIFTLLEPIEAEDFVEKMTFMSHGNSETGYVGGTATSSEEDALTLESTHSYNGDFSIDSRKKNWNGTPLLNCDTFLAYLSLSETPVLGLQRYLALFGNSEGCSSLEEAPNADESRTFSVATLYNIIHLNHSRPVAQDSPSLSLEEFKVLLYEEMVDSKLRENDFNNIGQFDNMMVGEWDPLISYEQFLSSKVFVEVILRMGSLYCMKPFWLMMVPSGA